MRLIGSHPAMGWGSFVAGAFFCVLFILKPPSAGIAVAVLAGGAAIMTIQKLGPGAKFLWLIFVLVMGITEIRAISTDRTIQDAQHLKDMKALLDQDKKIIDGSALQFQETELKFSGLLDQGKLLSKKANANLSASNGVLRQITGGNSYAAVVPQVQLGQLPMPLAVWNRGGQILSGIHIRVVEMNPTPGPPNRSEDFDIGTIPAHDRRIVPQQYWVTPYFLQAYTIEIYQQNGVFQEHLELAQDPLTERFMYNYTIIRTKGKDTRGGEQRSLDRLMEYTGWQKDEMKQLGRDVEKACTYAKSC